MSHELRTPLNSLLILSKLLSDNAQGNLTDKQVEFARTIHHAGSDLLGLINDILDLSKIESGTVTLDIGETSFASLRDHMDRTFAQIAQDKKLDFVDRASIRTCRARCTPTTSGCSRSSRTCCRTRSSSPRQGHVRLQDRAARLGLVDDQRSA